MGKSGSLVHFLEFGVYLAMLKKKSSVKITHSTQGKVHEGTKLEDTAESVEDI